MGRINYGRVILGGLLAGLILNLGELLLNTQIVGEDWNEAMRAIGKQPVSANATVIFVILGFVVGVLAIWLYAMIRPRFSPGLKTAIWAGLMVWALAYAWPSLSGMPMGIIPSRLFLISMIWGLFEVPIATSVGAWVYKE
jgi:hypothetical protein